MSTKKERIMAGNRDYIPSNDAAFDAWFRNLVEYVVGKTTVPPGSPAVCAPAPSPANCTLVSKGTRP